MGFDRPINRRTNECSNPEMIHPKTPLMKNTLYYAPLAALLFGAATLSAADATDVWAKNCAACHGKDGAGHTKAGRMARVKDMTSPQYQKGFTDEQAAAQIKGGLKDPSSGRIRMKAFGDVLTDDQVKDLVAYVRSLRK